MKVKHVSILVVGLLAGAGFVAEASAASAIDAPTAAAIDAGYVDLMATATDVLKASWKYLLGGLALLSSPKLVMHFGRMIFGGR